MNPSWPDYGPIPEQQRQAKAVRSAVRKIRQQRNLSPRERARRLTQSIDSRQAKQRESRPTFSGKVE